jgi:hypothetical protein
MDLITLVGLFFLAVGGVALDAYQHPKTLVIKIVHHGDDTGAGLDRGLVNGIVVHELDRMARVPSMLAKPHIRPSEEKGVVEALGDATGTSAILDVVASTVQEPPDAINLGVFTNGGKLEVYVYGSVSDVPTRDGRYDLIVTQADGENPVDTIKRATISGAARIDPYLAMLYLLSQQERTGEERFVASALGIARYAEQRLPPSTPYLLLPRIENIEGLVQLRLGKLDEASAAFADGLSHISATVAGPTPVILILNKALVDLVRGDTEGATALLTQVDTLTNHFDKLVGMRIPTSEGAVITLSREQVDFLRSAADTIVAGIAIRRGKLDEAEARLKEAMTADPRQIGAISLLADIEATRGNQAAEAALRKQAARQAVVQVPYIEVAVMHMMLTSTGDKVTLKPSQYITR